MLQKNWQRNVLCNPTRASDITAHIATAAVSKNLKNLMSKLPELVTFS